jgi:hypothetical protein
MNVRLQALYRAVYGVPLVLPNEFLQVDEFSVDTISKKFVKILDTKKKSKLMHRLPRQWMTKEQFPSIWMCGQ